VLNPDKPARGAERAREHWQRERARPDHGERPLRRAAADRSRREKLDELTRLSEELAGGYR